MIFTIGSIIGGLSSSGGVNAFTNRVLLTSTTDQTQQFVTLTKQEGMSEDFSDVRFVIDTSGSGKEKFFLDYELLSYNGTHGFFKVAHPNYFSIGETYYAIWGKPTATSKSHPGRTAFSAGWLTNYFDKSPLYTVSNVFAAYDTILSGPGDATQEHNWPCLTQNPVFQSNWGTISDNDWNAVYVGMKYDIVDNIHAGRSTSSSRLKYTLDFGATWSAIQTIYDPDADYVSASSSSVAIPTAGATEVTFTVPAGRAWTPGTIARAFADGTHFFYFTVTSYSGTTLIGTRLNNTGTGTFSSWTISQNMGATNTVITSVKMPNGVIRLVAAYSIIDFYNTEAVSSNISRVYSSYSDLTNGVPGPWSAPIMISDDEWSNVGGKATTTHDGIVWMTYHENAVTTVDYASCVAYSRDYGLTWNRIRTVHPGAVLLDETDLIQLQDPTTGEWINKIRATCRNEESATTSNHQYTYDIVWDESTASSENIRENNWYDTLVSRYTSVRCPDWTTIFWAGGDATEKMVYTKDEGQTFTPIPINTLTTSSVSARRVYTVLAVHPDGRMMKIWASNRQPNGSDMYINYFDWTLNQLYCDNQNTLSNGNGVRNRPSFNNPGIHIGEWYTGYRTSSTTSISVPTGAGQQRTLTVGTGLNWIAGDLGTCIFTTNNGVRFTFTCISYNSGTGELVVEWLTNTGTGTQATWQINRGNADNVGNLLSNQAYLSIPKSRGNGRIRPSKTRLNVRTYGTGGITGGSFGFKKFENRATAVVTITNAGATGDVITIKWNKSGAYSGLFGGMGILATYTVESGDTIADVVAGLVASANSIGVSPVSASDGTTLTMMAPYGNSTFINTNSLTITVTGTVAGSSGAFASGAAIESSTTLSNIILFDNPNNVVRIEQANDNFNAAFTVSDGPTDYTIEWDDTETMLTNGVATVTKTVANGSGVPNWEEHMMFFLTTSNSSVQGLLDIYQIIKEPLDQTPPTEGSVSSGTWVERTDGRGIL